MLASDPLYCVQQGLLKGCFWPSQAYGAASQVANMRSRKHCERLHSTQSGLCISNLVGELTGSPGQDHATGNSRRDAQYQRPYRPR
jgi:hypothetical protein